MDGIKRIVGYRVISDYPLVFAIGKSTEVALADYEQRKRNYIMGAALASIFILAFCSMIIKRSTQLHTLNMELKRNHDRLAEQAKLLDSARDYIMVCDMNNRITYWNYGAQAGYGWLSDEVLGLTAQEVIKSQYPEPLEQIMKVLITNGYWEGKIIHTHKDGRGIIVQSHWTLNQDEYGDPVSILKINHDITEKLKMEQNLRERELQAVQGDRDRLQALECFQRVFSNSVAVMAIIRASDMTYLDVNEAWERTWGYTRAEAIGRTPLELGFGDCQAEGENIASSQAMRESLPVEYIGHTKSGEKRIVLSQVTVIQEEPEKHILYILLDITKTKQYEQELAHLDRLNIVGEVAAGIGHEVRNPMTTVRGYLQMLQAKSDFVKYHEHFSMMIEELDRANSIISEFLSLAKDKAVEMKRGNLNNVIRSLFPLLQADAFSKGQQIQADVGEISDNEFDEKEIRQLILNLVRNGLEAMGDGGEVIIRTYQKDDSIVLEVQDTGSGIPDEIKKKLGTPFVTTKDSGTGLGLPVCYRIAERHGAKIDVKTGPAGTTFTVTFNPKR